MMVMVPQLSSEEHTFSFLGDFGMLNWSSDSGNVCASEDFLYLFSD